jgi:uncharacterized cupredoxin-like copper-binding protein
MKPPPTSTFFSALVLTGLVAIAPADTVSSIDWSKAQTVELRMIEYQFIPDQLTLRHGQPYRLHLVNAGKEGHDFTAPEFPVGDRSRHRRIQRQQVLGLSAAAADDRYLSYCPECRIVCSPLRRS